MVAEVKQFKGTNDGTTSHYKVEIFLNEQELEDNWEIISAYPHIVTRLETT